MGCQRITVDKNDTPDKMSVHDEVSRMSGRPSKRHEGSRSGPQRGSSSPLIDFQLGMSVKGACERGSDGRHERDFSAQARGFSDLILMVKA